MSTNESVIVNRSVSTFRPLFIWIYLRILSFMSQSPIAEKAVRWFPLVFALLFFGQGFFVSLEKSLTWDEPIFIASGYTYLTRNDFRLNSEAPPLMQQLEALPLLGMDLRLPEVTHRFWQKAQHIWFARKFIQDNASQVLELTLRARFPVLLIGAGLILLIGYWGQRLYGPWPAAVAAATAGFSPNLLAHAKLATTDLGCTAFMFLSVFTFWKAVQTGRIRDWALLGLTTGLALLTKYTALLLGPIYVILAGVCLFHGKRSLVSLLKGSIIAGIVMLVVIGAGYNFSFNLPLYLAGMKKIYANAAPGYLFYLQGEVAESPWWYYYFTAFFLKVPVPIILLMALAAFSCFKDSNHREAAVFVLVPTLVVMGAACFDEGNLGFRRILPALPFLFLFCAQTLAHSRKRLTPWLLAGLVAWTTVEAVRIYPHHLSYLNGVAGGPESGPYHLDDSSIDWGQDLHALAAWQRAHPEARPLKILYFGNVPPKIYGVDAVEMKEPEIFQPEGGTYAISAHKLVWFRKLQKERGVNTDWLTKYKPIARAGYSIYIYRFPQKKEAAISR